jgi:hypothetical protein
LLCKSICAQIHLNGQNGLFTIHKLNRSNFSSPMSRDAMSP